MYINFTASQINILSYNVYMRPYLVNGPGGDCKSERLQDLINIIDKYDILCLQEMFRSITHRQDYLIEQSYKKGYEYFARVTCPSIHDQFQVDSGLLILSKLPILHHAYKIFEHYDTSDGFAKKGILYAKIQLTNDQCLHLFNTHTQASYHHPTTGKDIRQAFSRIQQLKGLQKFVDKITKQFYKIDDLVMVMGDFNVNSLEQLYPKQRIIQMFDESSQLKLEKNNFKNEYEIMQTIFQRSEHLEFIDIGKQVKKNKIPTFGKFKVIKSKKKDDYLLEYDLEKLDYIFHVIVKSQKQEMSETDNSSKNIISKQLYDINYETFSVNDFEIPNKIYNQISDHASLSIALSLNQQKQYIYKMKIFILQCIMLLIRNKCFSIQVDFHQLMPFVLFA